MHQICKKKLRSKIITWNLTVSVSYRQWFVLSIGLSMSKSSNSNLTFLPKGAMMFQ